VVSSLLGLNELLVKRGGLFFKITDFEFVSKFNLIVFLLLIFKVICQSLPILVVLLFLLFSLVCEFLFHLIYFYRGLFFANDRLSVRTLKTLQHGLMGLSVLLGFLLLIFQLELSELQLLFENSFFFNPCLFSHLESVLSLFQLSLKFSHPLLVQSLVIV